MQTCNNAAVSSDWELMDCRILRSRTLWMLMCWAALVCQEGIAQSAHPVSNPGSLINYVRGIEGRSPQGRRNYVKKTLTSFGVRYSTMDFDTVLTTGSRKDTIHGENIIVTLGKGNRWIVVGAHYDAFPNAAGANDDGSGVAVLLGMIRNLKHHKWRHTVEFCFFDQEEAGLIGSSVFVRQYQEKQQHLAMINLDVEGTGDRVYVGPVGGGDDDLIMKYIHAARDTTRLSYEEDPLYPGSDYESFAEAKLENISISVVPAGDVRKLVEWTRSGFKPFREPSDVPEVLKVMHTPSDVSKLVTSSALAMSYIFTTTTLLLLDAGEP